MTHRLIYFYKFEIEGILLLKKYIFCTLNFLLMLDLVFTALPAAFLLVGIKIKLANDDVEQILKSNNITVNEQVF